MSTKTSESVTITTYRQTAAGAASTGKVLADFVYEFRLDGAVSAITPTVTEGANVGAWREYHFAFTTPATPGRLTFGPIQPASGTDVISPDLFVDDIQVYDMDALAGLFISSSSVTVSPTASSGTATIFHGDTIQVDMPVNESSLTALGAASLAAIDTLACGVKLTSNDSGDAQDATLTTSIISDTSGNRIVRATAAFPAILAVPDGQRQVDARIDLRATEGTKTFIIATVALTVNWKATTA
jgi:hypothetical protein